MRLGAGEMPAGGDAGPPSWHDDDGVARLRVPPHSMEAEQSVLGGLLIDNVAIERVGDLLAPADFYRHEHRLVYEAITAMLAAGQPVDIITVLEHLQRAGKADEAGGLRYLNDMAQSVPSAANIRRYAEIVRERAVFRRLISATDDIATMVFNAQGRSAQTVLEEAGERLADVVREHHRQLPGPRVPLMDLAALRAAAGGVRWLIKHVVPMESIGMLFGGSGTFKSFIALDCALHVCHGLPWLGRRTNKGGVLYIAAEGGAGLWPRIDAWHRDRGLHWKQAPLYVVPAAIDLAADAWRVVDAAQAVGVTPAMVVVDTLSQTYAGEENSANEMAAYLRELGRRFRQLWGCSVLLIHHTGHQATERPRGSSAIRANLDFMFSVFRDEKEMLATLSCVKQKDVDAFADATFALRMLELGVDDENDPITSLVARRLSTAEEIQSAAQEESAAGRSGRAQLLMNLVTNGMAEKGLRKAFYEELGAMDSDAKKHAYHRALNRAKKQGLVEVAEDLILDLRKGQK